MSEKMFPPVDIVAGKSFAEYTANEIRRVGDCLERILHLLENSALLCKAGCTNLDNGTLSESSPSSQNEVLTVSEAAKILRISLPKMYDLVHEKKVHALMVGRKILVSRSSLIELLKEGDN